MCVDGGCGGWCVDFIVVVKNVCLVGVGLLKKVCVRIGFVFVFLCEDVLNGVEW